MSIKDVIPVRRMLHIYNEKGQRTGTINAFNGLIGFTAELVSVRHMDRVLIYNEHGILRSTTPA